MWSGALGRLTAELGGDLPRFVGAMKRHRGDRGVMPGAAYVLRRRPLGLPYSISWYWPLETVRLPRPVPFNLSLGVENDGRRAVGKLVVTAQARVAALYLEYRTHVGGRRKAGNDVPNIDRSGRIVSDMPKALFHPPTVNASEKTYDPRTQVPRRPPSADEVTQLLAFILETHDVLL